MNIDEWKDAIALSVVILAFVGALIYIACRGNE